MITAETIREFAPKAWGGYVDAFVTGKADIEAAGIDTPLIWSHFIAQLAHESGGLTLLRENTRWTGEQMKRLWPKRFPLGKLDPRIIAAKGDARELANIAYSGRAELGNQGDDDGWHYRGGGLIQITGRACYREAGEALDLDLEGMPELIEDPAVSLRVALWFWTRANLSLFAQHDYGRAVGNGINRGNPYASAEPIGYQDRQQWLKRAWALWGEGQPLPDGSTLHLGAYGPKVSNVQARLRQLGYPVGATDGVFGPTLARALAGFKLDRRRAGVDLEPDERVGPLTFAALDQEGGVLLSPERERATAATLAAAGSTEVAAGQKSKGTGQALLYTGAVAGASEVGLLDQAKDALGWLPGAQTVLAPVLAAVQWGLKNALWVAVIVLGVWMWVKGKDVILARLRAHQTGANLGR
jgi:putative chitinase